MISTGTKLLVSKISLGTKQRQKQNNYLEKHQKDALFKTSTGPQEFQHAYHFI